MDKEIKEYVEQTKADMKVLGIYKPQFDPIINVYAETLYQYNETNKRYLKGGMKNQTKTSGGMKTSPIVGILTNLKKEIITYSDRLGLTPKALDSIKNAQEEEKKTRLEIALEGFTQSSGKFNSSND